MAVGWSPAGSKSDTILIAMPPSDFSGRAGRCGTHSSPFLCSGLPLSISADSAATVAVTPRIGQRVGIFQRDVEAGDRIEAGGGALLGGRRAAHRRAARRLGRRGGALGDFLSGAPPPPSLAARLPRPRRTGPVPPPRRSGAPSRRSNPTAACRQARPAAIPPSRRAPAVRRRRDGRSADRAGRARRNRSVVRRGDFFSGDLAIARNMGANRRNGKVGRHAARPAQAAPDRRVSGTVSR